MAAEFCRVMDPLTQPVCGQQLAAAHGEEAHNSKKPTGLTNLHRSCAPHTLTNSPDAPIHQTAGLDKLMVRMYNFFRIVLPIRHIWR